MASLNKIYTENKLKGKIYTPKFVVEKILDDIGFNNKNILRQTILDPACGDGRFLEVVAERIIKFSKPDELQKNLTFIHGWDIDKDAIELCKNNLDKLVQRFDFTINWNIQLTNSIEIKTKSQKFDFIIGNPPYIRIQHLDQTQRKYIQQNYKFCQKGSTDIYIAFFELCYNLLNDKGICGLITPNTYFYTETAKKMRDDFSNLKCIKQITNYAEIQLFDNATTYSAITIFNKLQNDTFLFQQAENQTKFKEKPIKTTELENQKFWQLSTENISNYKGKKLKDICKIHVGITTLKDKAYIFRIEEFDKNYVYAQTFYNGKVKIERSILKPIVKGSTLKSSNDAIKEYVLFPFEKINGKHKIIDEKKLKKQFPLAYKYLLSIKDELAKRDNGKPIIPWYNFGRSQGLDTSFGKKIIFSPMNKTPNFILYENEECTFYSGYCLKYAGDYDFLLQKLNSEKMRKYIEMSSRDFRGGWKAYNKKIVEEFIIEQ